MMNGALCKPGNADGTLIIFEGERVVKTNMTSRAARIRADHILNSSDVPLHLHSFFRLTSRKIIGKFPLPASWQAPTLHLAGRQLLVVGEELAVPLVDLTCPVKGRSPALNTDIPAQAVPLALYCQHPRSMMIGGNGLSVVVSAVLASLCRDIGPSTECTV